MAVQHREARHPGGVGPGGVGLDEQGAVAGVGGVSQQVSGDGRGEHRDERAMRGSPPACGAAADAGTRNLGRGSL